ncbi:MULTISPECIES: BTAD domain-containing putative transcriptional regulator [unclassified Roseibium]|uniref:BTAD domain-containing putative transcriptional regulator n=1 Tax=unclassified Roseibium TaxID=2629323 RepID=UPI00317527E0
MGEAAFNHLFDLQHRNRIALRPEAVDVDLVSVAAQLEAGKQVDLSSLMGPGLLELLGQLELAREPELSEWVFNERAHWTNRIVEGLLDFTSLVKTDKVHSERLRRASIALRLDPANEGAHCAIMIAHAVQGNPLAARRHFEKLETYLKTEFDCPPQDETISVFKDITSGSVRSAHLPKPSQIDHVPSERIRIAVLPFTVKPDNFEEGLLRIGICEQIIEALSKLNDFAAVAHSSVFGMSVDAMPPAELGQILHVQYIVQGLIREIDGQIKVNVQFVRCSDAEVLLTLRYRQTQGKVFELEDQIARDLAGDLEMRVLKLEIDRAIRSAADETGQASEWVLRAIPSIYRLSRDEFDTAFISLKKALELDPNYAPAHSWMAFWYAFYLGQGWGNDKNLTTAGQHARQAIELAPDDSRAYAIAGHVDSFLMRQPELGEVMLDKSLYLNPNSGFAWAFSAINQCYLGHSDVALQRMKEYSSLCPQDPFGYFFDTIYCIAHTLLGQFETGAEWGRRTTNGNPNFVNAIKPFLVCLGHLNLHAEAARMRKILLARQPNFTVESVRQNYPLRDPDQLELYCEGLRKAGIPER